MSEHRSPIIVDTNILFSALLREPSPLVELLFRQEYEFYICEYVIVELFKHKGRLQKYSKLSEDELLRLLYRVLKRLQVYPERLLDPVTLAEAKALCAQVDTNDTVHVALTIALDGLLWTGDRTLVEALRNRGFDRFFTLSSAK